MKKDKDIFFNIKNIGKLFLDYVFFKFEMEPLLFTCVDKDKHLYFCHCYKMLYEQKWFVVPVEIQNIEMLIRKKLDIRSLILNTDKFINITVYPSGREVKKWVSPKDDSVFQDLPDAGVFLECDEEDALLHICEFKLRNYHKLHPKQIILADYYTSVFEPSRFVDVFFDNPDGNYAKKILTEIVSYENSRRGSVFLECEDDQHIIDEHDEKMAIYIEAA